MTGSEAPNGHTPAVRTAVATRQGTRDHNADAAVAYTTSGATTAAVVVDGIGSSALVAEASRRYADVIVRIAVRADGLAGILTAAALAACDGPDGGEPDAVAAVAVTAGPDDDTVVHWVGDCRAYGLAPDGALRQLTTDHTVGQQLRDNGVALDLAEEHDNWVRVTLRYAVVATVYRVVVPGDHLVLLTTDGVHDTVPHHELTALASAHAGDPQALADAIVNAVQQDDDGYRDDATVVVLDTRCAA